MPCAPECARFLSPSSSLPLPEIRIHVDPDVLLVSHLLDEVRETCTRARWLAEGLVVHDGPAAEVMEAYQA